MKREVDSPNLIFDWHKRERRWTALVKWFLATVAAMVGFSYVFKVIYPQVQRTVPSPQQITVLNPADPSMRALLHRIADQDYLIIPDSHSAGQVRMEDHMPVFHPSYENHQYQLEDLPHQAFTVPPVRLLDPSAPMLPPPDLSRLEKPAAAPAGIQEKPRLDMVCRGALAGRKIRQAPDFSRLQLADPDAWRIHIGVDGQGRVAFALPISVGEPASLAVEWVGLVSEVRFEPVPSATDSVAPAEEQTAITWDIATFHWAKPFPP